MNRPFGSRYRYRSWDNTQNPLTFDGDDALDAIADDLMYHGDLHAAIRRAMRDGFDTKDGRHMDGIREMLERLRERREALQQQMQPNNIMAGIQEQLEEIIAMERNGLDQQVADATKSGDEHAREQTSQQAAERNAQLDLLPNNPAAKIHELSATPFSTPQAQERFDELMEQLRHDLVQMQIDQAAEAMRSQDPAQKEHLRSGLDALNRMIEQRAAGEEIDPSFESFMEEYGDLFPEASSLEDLLEQMAARMAATSQMLAAMTPEQRAQLEELAAELMGDMDMAWQLDRLSENLRDAIPTLSWDRGFQPGQGEGSFSLGEAGDAIGEMAEMSLLEEMLRSATEPGALAEIDFDAVEQHLGQQTRESLEQMARLTKQLEEKGHIERSDGQLKLTPRGLRRLGQQALNELFSKLRKDRFGGHQVPSLGFGQDQAVSTKQYEFGDPFHLHIEQTVRNAISRAASEGSVADGAPVINFPLRLTPDDFAITQTEHVATASTVLAVDLSLSMPMRDNFLAAKKVAVALQSLIESRYPRDYLGLVGFSATARELKKNELPELSWDFAYGTNLQHALWLGRRMLANRPGSKQIILITDGEPTAHVMDDGEVFFNYPPERETLEATYAEVLRCTKERIVINAFVLDATPNLRAFIEQMTKRNHGRAFFTTPETLGDFVLLDFVEHRRSSARRIRPA